MTSGVNLSVALKAARRLGCRLSLPRRTGEGRITHPRLSHGVRFNSRRKDAPRSVTQYLRLVAELADQPTV
jgi:hypothetical protein